MFYLAFKVLKKFNSGVRILERLIEFRDCFVRFVGVQSAFLESEEGRRNREG